MIGDFKIGPESSWARSNSGETCITDSYADDSVTKVVGHGETINVLAARIPDNVKWLDQEVIKGKDVINLKSKESCSF